MTIDEIIAAVGNALNGCSPLVSQIFRAHLTGDQESPPIVSSATGTAVMTLSVDEQMGFLDLTVEGIDLSQVLASHLHVAPPGVPGAIVYTLFHIVNGEPFHNPWHVTLRPQDLEQDPDSGVNTFADLIAKIRAGGIYVNVHTQRNGGGGEIRGQLLTDPSVGSSDTIVGRDTHTSW